MENQKKTYPSYFGDFYAANPAKFEKRKNNIKPKIYYALAAVAIVLVVFPGMIPFAGWLVRTGGVILAIIFLFSGYMSSFDIYNINSGGIIKNLGVKKFKRDETDMQRILSAFLQKDFEYLADLPGGSSEPVQLHIEEDKLGQEMYCLLTTYDSDSNIVGLADVITLSGNEYLDNIELVKQMFKDAEND